MKRQPWARRGGVGVGDNIFFPRLTWKQKLRLRWIKFRNHRPDKDFHDAIKKITESQTFNLIIIVVILLNSAVIAIETDPEIEREYHNWFTYSDYAFLAVYTIEFVMKFYAEPVGYWLSAYNLFDFAVLVISAVQVALDLTGIAESSDLDALKILRALRTLRTLRTVSFIKGLQVLVTALLDVIVKWLLNILSLLLLLMYLFGVCAVYFYGYKTNTVRDEEHWGSLPKAMLTLFGFVTLDGWTDIQNQFDEKGLTASRMFTMVFIFLGHFIFTNIFVGVIITNISQSTEKYETEKMAEKEAVIRHKKEFMMTRQQDDVKKLMSRQRNGPYGGFDEMVREHEDTLKHHDPVIMTDITTNIIWIESYLQTLDNMDQSTYRCLQLYFEMGNTLAAAMEEKLRDRYGIR